MEDIHLLVSYIKKDTSYPNYIPLCLTDESDNIVLIKKLEDKARNWVYDMVGKNNYVDTLHNEGDVLSYPDGYVLKYAKDIDDESIVDQINIYKKSTKSGYLSTYGESEFIGKFVIYRILKCNCMFSTKSEPMIERISSAPISLVDELNKIKSTANKLEPNYSNVISQLKRKFST